VIVLENHDYGEVIGNPEAPFLNELARRGALANRYKGVAHPSLPNYLALLGGSTFGVEEDCPDCQVEGPSLATQLSTAGLSWRAYMEDMPEACYDGAEHSRYVKWHNPFMYFSQVSENPDLCENDVPLTQLQDDLDEGTMAALTWISPNLCHNAHNCSLATADRWLSRLVPKVLRELGENGLLVITFDESEEEPRQGRVATVLAGPAVKAGSRLDAKLNHYSMLATFEDWFDLPRLRKARGANTLEVALK
jgi:hypothetical protein